MSPASVSNLVLWSVQAFLALFFFFAGAPKVLGRGLQRWIGFSELPRAEVVAIGMAEVLGAAGLLLPMAAGILPWLTPFAALGLAIIVLMASGFHLRANEYLQALETVLWAGIAVVVAVGRWGLVSALGGVPPRVIVGALGVLVPAVIATLVVLLMRPSRHVAKLPQRTVTT